MDEPIILAGEFTISDGGELLVLVKLPSGYLT